MARPARPSAANIDDERPSSRDPAPTLHAHPPSRSPAGLWDTPPVVSPVVPVTVLVVPAVTPDPALPVVELEVVDALVLVPPTPPAPSGPLPVVPPWPMPASTVPPAAPPDPARPASRPP